MGMRVGVEVGVRQGPGCRSMGRGAHVVSLFAFASLNRGPFLSGGFWIFSPLGDLQLGWTGV